uniref:Nuclear receptor domain-containing protein n=1 Tax=Gongylonema pulchrum TaxID=637853 RepID=A0A183CV98_9BILA
LQTVISGTYSASKYNCGVCLARATGYHFEAQSCSACAAFFRRAIAYKKQFRCKTGKNNCIIHYCKFTALLCQACRLRKCFAVGMNEDCKFIFRKASAAHLAGNRWSVCMSNRYSRKSRWPLGGLPKRWCSYIEQEVGINWKHTA